MPSNVRMSKTRNWIAEQQQDLYRGLQLGQRTDSRGASTQSFGRPNGGGHQSLGLGRESEHEHQQRVGEARREPLVR